MRNPLLKRIPKDLVQEAGKYLVIFLFLTLTIGFISGFLVADGSMKTAYDESFETYHIEDGHFTLAEELPQVIKEELTKEDINIYENFYVEREVYEENTFRIFNERKDVNQVSVLEGRLPEKEKEIVIDRLYAQNNGVSVGDTVDIDGKNYEICGLVAFSDYSCLFKNNTDMMFDAQKFSVAMVTEEDFEKLKGEQLHFQYSWTQKEKDLTEKEKKDRAEDILKILASQVEVKDFVKTADNQAIQFAGEDMGGDRAMMIWLLYIVIAIMAFIFAITTGNTIEKEAAVIGTLRASGYTRGEVIVHYMMLPVIVSFVAAVLGNILGYSVFKNVVVDLYYGSYSLPTYQTIWNGEAFVLTTIVPCVIMLAVNFIIIRKKLSLSPLKFLRRDLKKKGKKKAVKLPDISFLSRFRIRVILQNLPTYLMMLFGVLLANVMLMFGMMMTPLLDNYKEDVLDNMISNYQYVLKAPAETKTEGAEKYAVTSLEMKKTGEEITVYGIQEDSKYLSILKEDGIVLSDGYMEKYNLKPKDTIELEDKYGEEKYTFTVNGEFHYPAGLAVFMTIEEFRDTFDKEEDYYTGYLSDKEITDIDDAYIASVVTEHDMTIITDQLEDSMGGMMPMIAGFAIILYMLMTYLLSKLILEKNAASVSMVKIMGYQTMEIGKLYLMSTVIMVLLSLIVSIPLSYYIIKYIYYLMMQEFNGWLTYYVGTDIFIKMFVMGVLAYVVIGVFEVRKITKIPMEEALKNAE